MQNMLQITFETTSAVCGTSRKDRFYPIVGRVPSYAVCGDDSACLNRAFHRSSTAVVVLLLCAPRYVTVDTKSPSKKYIKTSNYNQNKESRPGSPRTKTYRTPQDVFQ